MEVAIGGNGTTPFQREVREWQHVDPNTGALLTSRLEADRWVNGPSNAYGKVVDSKNVSQPNGTQHTQRKQFEVLQARTSSGSLQVVRAQTVHKSSSRWSSDVRSIASGNHSNSQTFANGITNGHHSPIENGYEDNRIENTPSFKLTQRISQNSSPIIPPTSLKLSTLIKNDEKNNAHSLTSSSLLLQHQQFLNERKHNILISRQDAALDEKRTFSETFGGATQNMTDSGISVNFHVRGKSVSIDDLTIEREQTDDGPDSPSEWRRVSKIRRSFQFPKSTSPKPTTQRPVDLPENSVSVSRLREELENGRRLNTAMRGNTIDLVALDNILNGPTLNEGEDKTEAKPIKKATFLTAESLKEIRGKLRKLSDESLYKDDFLIGNRISETERQCRDENDMLVQNETISQSNEYSVQQPIVLHDSQIVLQKPTFLRRDKPPETSAFTTNSLEGRSKYRDLSSAEWHLRRKSYGFEKMAPSTSSMFRMETSTDSGIGRSSELASWSLSEAQAKTVIMFGDNETTKRTLTFLPGSNTDSHTPSLASFSSARQFFDSPSKNEAKEVKRHSIAVDESKYVRDNLKEVFDTKTSVHLNGLYNKDLNLSQASMSDENGKRTKRVEFCKTEVHFVADSGRVNIVETDGKPPPTNNFRRRRRTANSVATSAYLQAINSGIPVTHFGDDQKPSFETEAKNPLDATFAKTKKSNVTVSTPLTPSDTVPVPKSSLQEEEEDQSVSEEISLRGILKNKPVKPKPYHLGENIDSSESLWGVRLKPVGSKSIGVKEPNDSDDAADTPSKESSPTGAINIPSVSKFAADKLPNLEQAKAGSNYLTKVKLNTSDSWESPDVDEKLKLNKPIKLHLEEIPKRSTLNEPTSSLTTSSSSSISSPSSLYVKNPTREFESKTDESLKSTSLIMKTIRSANQFDEAMKRLSITDTSHNNDSFATAYPTTTASKLISNMNAITKSNSANSIFQDQPRVARSKYASSLDGDFILNSIEETKSSKLSSSATDYPYIGPSSLIRPMQVLDEESQLTHEATLKAPIAAPRIRVIGTSNAINHQLSQLRRMYDADSDDSAKADEEVNSYLGDGFTHTTLNEEKCSELSGSWSRVKAKRTNEKFKISKNEVKDLNESNVLSIEFNSPPSSLKRTTTGIKPSPQEVIPTARPRNITPGVAPSAVYKEEAESHGFKTTIHAHSTETKPQNPKAPLKVGTGGARKLRDHELSYFGVKVSHNPHMDIKIDDRKRNTRETQRIVVTNKSDPVVKQHYKLTSDKPDLLSHSLEVEPRRSKDFHVSDEQSEQEHIYENIDECFTPYSRKSDLERDERNLNEMAREAKLSLKPLKEKRSSKSQLSKSSSYKPHKPLDTINEKTSSRSHSQQSSSREHSRTADKSAKQKIPLSPYSGHESIQRPCRMNRRSSASSNESLSRSPLSRHSHPRRSSEEREDKSETRAIKKPSSVIRECTKLRQRSSSRESRTNASSSEDTSAKEIHDHLRKVKRTKQKEPTKPVEKCEPKLHQSRQAIVTSTARSFAEPEERRKIRNATVHSTSSHHTTEGGKSSRKTVKSERKERSSSASRSRSSSTATDAPKSRTRSSRDAPTTSRSSKPSSTRR